MWGRCADQGHHRQRQRAQPGLQGGQPTCLLQVERVQEQETRERPESTDADRGRTGERDAAEEAQLGHWIDPARLIDQQGPDRQERQHQLAQCARRRPARSRRVDDRVSHTRQCHHHQQLINGIHPPGPRRPRLGDGSGVEGDRGEAEGMLTQKMDRQPTVSTSTPPTIGPNPRLIPTTPPHTPMARARSQGSVKSLAMIDIATGLSIEAPTAGPS